jgi:hypothetical protein
MPWAYVAGANLVGSLIGSDAAKSASNTQAGSAQNALDFQKQQFNTIQQQTTGGRAAGANALNQLGALGSGTYGMYDANGNQIGTGTGSGFLTKEYTPADFAQGIDPGYQFRLQQGQEATNRMANMGGGLISGNALKGQEDYTQGLASTEFGNAFNRFQTGRTNIYNTLAGIAGLGQNMTNTSATAAGNAANSVGSTIQNLGAAQASGTVGAANAITGGLQNAGNQYYLSQLLGQRTPTANYGLTGGGGMTTNYAPNDPTMGGGQGIKMGGGQGLIPSFTGE